MAQLDPQAVQQTLLGNIAGNLVAAGQRGPTTSPGQALQSLQDRMLARKSQTLQNTLAQRQEDRLSSAQTMAQKEQERLTQVHQQMMQIRDLPIPIPQKVQLLEKLGPEGQTAAKQLWERFQDVKKVQEGKNEVSYGLNPQGVYGELGRGEKGSLVEVNTAPEISKDYMWVDPSNPLKGVKAIPGGPADIEAQEKAEAVAANKDIIGTAAQTVYEDIDRTLDLTDKYGSTATGMGAVATGWIPTTPADRVQKLIDSVKGNIGVDSLLKIKKSGAGLGHIPQAQLEMLAGLLGKIDSKMHSVDLKYNLQRIQEIYSDIVEQSGGDPREVYESRKQEYGSTKNEDEEILKQYFPE